MPAELEASSLGSGILGIFLKLVLLLFLNFLTTELLWKAGGEARTRVLVSKPSKCQLYLSALLTPHWYWRQTQVSMDFSSQLFKLLIQEIVLGKKGLLFQPRPGHFESWYYLHPARTVLFMYVSRHLFSSSSDGNDGNEQMCRVFTAHPWRGMGELRE